MGHLEAEVGLASILAIWLICFVILMVEIMAAFITFLSSICGVIRESKLVGVLGFLASEVEEWQLLLESSS
jgi:hypothetical protein